MSTRVVHRARFVALGAALTMVAALVLPAVSPLASTGTPTAAAAVAPPTPTNTLRLNVTSALASAATASDPATCASERAKRPAGDTDVPPGCPPLAGEHIAQYKWLIQQDTSGDPNQVSGPVASSSGSISCTGGTCTLTDPSAPFAYSSADATSTGQPAQCTALTGVGTNDPNSSDISANAPAGQPPTEVTFIQPGTNTTVTADITAVCDAQAVLLGPASGHAAPPNLTVTGTFLYTIARFDPCHPPSPDSPNGDANFPANCNWPTTKLDTHAPVVTQGDQNDWNNEPVAAYTPAGQPTEPAYDPTNGISGQLTVNGKVTDSRCYLTGSGTGQDAGCTGDAIAQLPAGKYFVSATADGYELSGSSFTLPATPDPVPGQPGSYESYATVNVGLNPGPLTLGTMKLIVYDDMAPTGSAYETTSESGMSGFTAHITDYSGNQISTDYYGNPLCTVYDTYNQNDPALNGQMVVDATGTPVLGSVVGRVPGVSDAQVNMGHLGGQCVSTPVTLGLLAHAVTVGQHQMTIQIPPQTSILSIEQIISQSGSFTVEFDGEPITVTATTPACPPQANAALPPTSQQCPGLPANGQMTWTLDPHGPGFTLAHAAGTAVPDPSDQPNSDGIITIPNLAPGHYAANVVPPDRAWIQTETLEGGKDYDVWLMGNDTGLDNELVQAGEPIPWVEFGFARAAETTFPYTAAAAAADNNPICNTCHQTIPTSDNTYATAGCFVAPQEAADGVFPSGDIRLQFESEFTPCKHGNQLAESNPSGLTPRMDPGMPGQKPTPDGSIQADSWDYPFNPALFKSAPTGEITGRIVEEESYVPGVGGINGQGGANGQAGLHQSNFVIPDAWLALSDLNNGEQTSMVFPAKDDGTFDVKNVPDGDYNLAEWDWNQDYAFDHFTVVVQGGEIVRLGAVPLLQWFTRIDGYVFVDTNGNGKRDPGEPGVPDWLMQILNRTNNPVEGGQNVATTNNAGYYRFTEAYPLGNELVLQFYNQRYKTTGVTCQGDNDPQEHTVLTPAVDLSSLNMIAQDGRCDIGVQPYSPSPTDNDNGGIVATMMYHSFRAEYTEEKAFTNSFDTGTPGFRTSLWEPRRDAATGNYMACTGTVLADGNVQQADGNEITPLGTDGGGYQPCPGGADGALVADPVPWDTSGNSAGAINVYQSEHYDRPGNNAGSQPGCVPRTADGTVEDSTIQEAIAVGGDCVESSLEGTSFGFATDDNPVDPNLYNSPNSSTLASLDPGQASTGCAADGTPNGVGPKTFPCAFTNGPDTSSRFQTAIPYPGINNYCTGPNAQALAQCGLHGVQVVDGNYTLTPPSRTNLDGSVTGPIPGDYIVHVDIPNDMFGKPMYKWATEATNNTYDGPGWMPQDAAGPMTWPVIPVGAPDLPQGAKSAGYSTTPSTGSPSPNGKCVGSQILINNTDPKSPDFVSNPSFVNYWTNIAQNPGGGTRGGPWEGQDRPLCDSKLIHVQNGQSYAPNFLFYTDVPLATQFQGYAVDDVSVETNKLSAQLGEVAGIADLPIGLYDWTGRQIAETNSDPDGNFQTLLPSTNTFNCNTPAGPCPGVYRWIGNDPGQPAHPNLNWNPQYRTISAEFQAWPDIYSSADVAPTRVVIQFEATGTQFNVAVVCQARASQPELYSVSHPFYLNSRADTHELTIDGVGFGSSNGAVQLLTQPNATQDLGPPAALGSLTIDSWSDTSITVHGFNTFVPGRYQLMVTNSAGLHLTNGLTFHVLGSGHGVTYMPQLYEVGTYNTGVLHQNAQGNWVPGDGLSPASKVQDNGYIDPIKPGAAGPVQDLVDSTKGFNPDNQDFLPAPPNAPASATNTGGLLPGTAINHGPRHSHVPYAYPGDTYVKGAVQRSLEAAYDHWRINKRVNNENLIVVYPNFEQDPSTGNFGGVAWDPLTAYFENIVVHSPVELQGTGSGGYYKDIAGNTVAVPGSTLDGRFFNANTATPALQSIDTVAGNEPWSWDWEALVGAGLQNPDGLWTTEPFYNNLLEAEAEVVYVLGNNTGGTTTNRADPESGYWYALTSTDKTNGYRPSIDGFQITGGDQKQFPDNISEGDGDNKVLRSPDESFDVETQGGGIKLQAFTTNWDISNNLIQWNSGTFGGAISSGYVQVDTDADPNAHNDNVSIHNNAVVANGGTNLSGAIGIFRGTDNYRINDNLICGNMAAEYGGGISHFGYSPGGMIDHNQIMLNYAVDEGGGVQIAGEPPIDLNTSTPNPNALSQGAGTVSVHDNFMGDNISYDDGGALHYLEAGVGPFYAYNNMMNDNVSADDGAGVSLDDAPNVQLVNNTITNNITTATAATSTGSPAPAGIASVGNSTQLNLFLNCWNGLNGALSYGGRVLSAPVQAQLDALCGFYSIYTVTIGGGATGGTFTLSYGGHTTLPIARNATALTVEFRLRALAGLGTAVVTGPRGGPYTITVTGAGGPLMASSAALTPHGTVTVAQRNYLEPFTTTIDDNQATQTTEDVAPQIRTVDCPQYLAVQESNPVTQFNGLPVPSAADLAACTQMGSAGYSDPAIVNDVLFNNLAGTWNPLHSTVTGIALPQNLENTVNGQLPADGLSTTPPNTACDWPATACVTPTWDRFVNQWDIGTTDNSDQTSPVGKMAPVNSLLNSTQDFQNPGSSNNTDVLPGLNSDPGTGGAPPVGSPNFTAAYLVHVQSAPYRLQPRFRPSTLITLNLPANVIGDYHLNQTSGATTIGEHTATNVPMVASPPPTGSYLNAYPVTAPCYDIFGNLRPGSSLDAGAHELTSVFNVTINGHPTGGTFKLSFGGQTTVAIARFASAATVQADLRLLVGLGSAVVTGANGGPYTVTIPGDGQLTATSVLLTPSGTVTVATAVCAAPAGFAGGNQFVFGALAGGGFGGGGFGGGGFGGGGAGAGAGIVAGTAVLTGKTEKPNTASLTAATTAPKPSATTGPNPSGSAGPLHQVVVSSPRGVTANLASEGTPDVAGNTPVVQLPGPKPAVSGVPQAQPVAAQAAPMPGGVSGGGRSQMPDTRHVYTRGGGSSSSIVSTVVKAPLSWVVLLALAGLALLVKRRGGRRRPAHTRAAPVTFNDRPLALAQKGERS
jgi:hypothetical protein